MFFGLFKLFRAYVFDLVPISSYHIPTESQCVEHAASLKSSNKVRRPEQDDYG
ncbi:hypothetical protein JJJA_0038 [Achromobacter phage JWDelta]|uniref:Uncharacterized protein n=1 Tax=Achromobacter phage JWDelta TaxID=1416008 RepID=V9SHN1_9CAUD|nr:hypothetical protein JJJA_0038 [Achromobacter phage JWDelta]